MITFDNQPFSVVEDSGLIRLVRVFEPRYVLPSKKYLVDKILPTVHNNVISWVKNELKLFPSTSVLQQMHGVLLLAMHLCLALQLTGL